MAGFQDWAKLITGREGYPERAKQVLLFPLQITPDSCTICHRLRKVFESGGQIGVIMNGGGHLCPYAWPKAVLKVGAGGVTPALNGGPGYHFPSPSPKIGNFRCKMGHLGAKLHFVLIQNKVQF